MEEAILETDTFKSVDWSSSWRVVRTTADSGF